MESQRRDQERKKGGLGGKEGRTRRGRGADKEGKRGSSGKNGKILEEREEGRKETGRRREDECRGSLAQRDGEDKGAIVGARADRAQ